MFSARSLWRLLTGARTRDRNQHPIGKSDAFERADMLVRKHAKEIQDIGRRYVELSSSTQPCNRVRAESSVRDLLRHLGKETGTFIWLDSPAKAMRFAILWRLLDAIFSIAEPVKSNRLVYRYEEIAAQLNPGDATQDKLLPDWLNRSPDWQIEMRISEVTPARIIRRFYHESLAQNICCELFMEFTGRGPKDKPILDVWLTTWLSISDHLRHVDVQLLERWQLFGDIFWALADEEQSKLLQKSVNCIWGNPFNFGNGDALEAMIQECSQLLRQEPLPQFSALHNVVQHCGWWRADNDVCVMVERPIQLHQTEHGQLHRSSGPALVYKDGFEVYAWQGILISRDVAYGEFTTEQIDTERNAEMKRVMIDRYGAVKYLQETGAKVIHKDSYGVLYRKNVPWDEPIVVVQVTNSTPEPDGSFKKYFLRVPPNMRTAREAVAWTFDVPTNSYKPTKET